MIGACLSRKCIIGGGAAAAAAGVAAVGVGDACRSMFV